MCGKIRSSEFIKFDFLTSTNASVSLDCSYNFEAQLPVGTEDKVLAILVVFQADSPKDIVHLYAQCRVIFDFTGVDELPNEDELIAENYTAAYQEFCKKANEALIALGQNCFDFQEI